MTSRKKRSHVLRNVIFCICVAVLAVSVFMIAKTLVGYMQIAGTQKEIRGIFFRKEESKESTQVAGEDQPEETEETDPHQAYDFDQLLAVNPDTVGWLSIPWIGVDHVVVQCDNNDDYLHWNLFREEENGGTFFLDYRTPLGASDNVILYGHSMYDGSMFGQLRKYFDQSFADQYPFFWLYTPEGVYRCDIISTYLTTVEDPYIQFGFSSAEEKLAYVEQMREKSDVVFPYVEVGPDDELLTISTCNYSQVYHDGRQPMLVRLTPYQPE